MLPRIFLLPDPFPQLMHLRPEPACAAELHEPAGMAVCAVVGEPSIGFHDEDRAVAWEREEGEHGAPRGGGWLGGEHWVGMVYSLPGACGLFKRQSA